MDNGTEVEGARHERSRPARRSAWAMVVIFMGALVAGVVALATGAGGLTPLNAKLEAHGGSGTSLASKTCAQAYTLLNTGTHSSRIGLPIGPLLFPTLTATNLSVSETSATCTTLTLQGTTKLFNKTATVLVIGHWASTSATTPTFTFAFRYQDVSLSSLLSTTVPSFGVTLTDAWLGTTTNGGGTNVTPSSLPAANQSFFTGMTGGFTVPGSGVGFEAELSTSGQIGTALSDLHIKKTSIQLTGTFAASVGTFSKTAPPKVSASFSVSVAVTLTLTPPSWLSFPQKAFKLTITGKSDHTWSVTVSGTATVTLPGESTPTPVSASIAIANGPTVTLSATLGAVSHPFGQSWLTLTKASLSWTISGSGTTAEVSATAKIDSATFGIDVKLSSSGSVSGTFTAKSTSKVLSASSLAADLGLGSLPSGAPTLTITKLTISLAYSSGTFTIAVGGQATITLNSKNVKIAALLRYASKDKALLIGLRPVGSFSLSQLFTITPNDTVTLPQLAIVLSTTTLTAKSPTLDTATWTYFRGIYCTGTTNPRATSTCTFTLTIPKGVGISATVTLPASLKQLVCKLVHPTSASTTSTSCVHGSVTVDGQIPLFGGTKLSLKISLPAITVSAGAFRQITLSLKISKTGDSFSLGVGGSLILVAPGSGTKHCPVTVTLASTATSVCLHLTVTATVSFTKGVSVTLTASLTGDWILPASSHLTLLTIQNLTLSIGVTAGEGVGVTLGGQARIIIGSTTLGMGIDLEFTPEPPWVNLIGFYVKSGNGISMHDVALLYHDVSGEPAPSGLPPLALRNLYFSFSSQTKPKLGLCTGIHISAALVFTTSTSTTFTTTTTPTKPTTCTAGVLGSPTKTSACSGDKHSCIASIFLTVGPNGIQGSGHIGAWNLGPVHFTTTTITIILKKTEVQLDVLAGGELLTPVTYWTKGTTAPVWASGHLTLKVGTQALALSASVTIAGATASISGSGSFDLLNPGFTLTTWLTQAKKWLTQAGQTVVTTFQTVGTTVKTWWTTYVAPNVNTAASDIQAKFTNLVSALKGTWQSIYALYQTISTVITGFNSTVNSLDLTFLDINVNHIFNFVFHGYHFTGWGCTKLGCLVPSFSIPGLCTDHPGSYGPLCLDTFTHLVTAMQQYFANPEVNTTLGHVNLALPPTANDKSLVQTLHNVDPATTVTPSTVISCAMAKVSYKTNTIGTTMLTVNTMGNQVTVDGPKPTQLGTPTTTKPTQVTNDHEVNQNTLDSLYSGQNQGTCTNPVNKVNLPPLSMSLTRPWVYEGSTVGMHGFVATRSVSSVTVTWGDGTSSSVPVPSTGKITATHTYTDETGASSTKSPYTVTLSATGVTPSVTKSVSVVDAALNLSSFATTASSADVMQPVTLRGTIANPETGEPTTAVIHWGDGTPSTTVRVTATGAFSATHTYERLVPSGAPSQKESITVTVAETDGTQVQGQTAVTVHDVAPSGTVLHETGGATTTNGVVFTHAGSKVSWTADSLDVSPQQGLHFDVAWGDGTPDSTATAAVTSGPVSGQYTYDVALGTFTHTYTNACYFPVTTTVTDLDTLQAPVLHTAVIATGKLGATVQRTTYWIGEVQAAKGGDVRPPLTNAAIGCYLSIAHFLSPQLGPLTYTTALSILQPPNLNRLSSAQKTAAMLRQQLLTALLDFANGSWDWTQTVRTSLAGSPLDTVVGQANTALGSGNVSAMKSVLSGLTRLVG